MIFSFCVYQVVSKTEFFPEPFYEEVYPETIYFDIEAPDAKTAVTAAADFLVNLQLECDEKYFALLDKHNIRYRKREEIIERRPFLSLVSPMQTIRNKNRFFRNDSSRITQQ